MTCLVWSGRGHVTAARLRLVETRAEVGWASPRPGEELQWCLFTSQAQLHIPGGGELPVCAHACTCVCSHTCAEVHLSARMLVYVARRCVHTVCLHRVWGKVERRGLTEPHLNLPESSESQRAPLSR